MFEQDYIMRLIKEIVRTILKLLFNIDTDTPSADILEDTAQRQMLDQPLRMVDDGHINEAEKIVYDLTSDGRKQDLKIALLFYSYLNDLSDEFLEEHNFSRDEIKSGLKDIASKYGVEGLDEIFS